jgi:hypothetical protein
MVMPKPVNVLILGASYGSLLATKLALAGYNTTLICLPAEAQAINRDGAVVRMPVKGRHPVEIRSKELPGKVSASAPGDVDPADYGLVGLAMQEPQYRSGGVRELLDAVAKARVPSMSIMNMPPLTYLRRISSLNADALSGAYTDPKVWRNFNPDYMTLCSPDPQAFRPPEEPVNVLQVTLPTNFKVSRFKSEAHTQMLRTMQADIEAVRWNVGGEKVELPVKLKVHDSVFVPLAKWAMLLTGNYRCVTKDGPRAIQQAVHDNLEESRTVYNWVKDVCVALGASPEDMVPFEKYAAAATGLVRPSSAARALFAGAPNIERVDRLVQAAAAQVGRRNPVVDATVALVDNRLAENRKAAA